MPKPMIPRPIRRWTALKLEHIEAYLKAYARATTSARERYYIDGFAGCGDCILLETRMPVEGSPWRALRVTPSFTNCFFVEQDPILAAHLRQRMSAQNNVVVIEGDCNIVIPSRVLPRLPRRAPSLAFLDPTGSQLHWNTVKALAEHRLGQRRMELLILYPYDMFIARWLKHPELAPALTAMFGGDSWQIALHVSQRMGDDADAQRRRFVNLYCDLLRSLGYKHVNAHPLYTGARPLYHIVFATDHDVGARIMRDVWMMPRAIPGELWYQDRLSPNNK